MDFVDQIYIKYPTKWRNTSIYLSASKDKIGDNSYLYQPTFRLLNQFMTDKQYILVTGGAGYIGSHTLIELLANPQFEVISLDNLSNSSGKTYHRIEQITGKKIIHAETNLCDAAALDLFFAKHPTIYGIIHFAAFKSVPDSVSDPLGYYSNNIGSLVNLLQAASKYAIRNIIFSSSCSVYGNIRELPVTEDTPFQKAESPYAYTKVVGERILEDYINSCPEAKAISLRYFNPVGAHISGLIGEDQINPPTNLVPLITQTAIGKRKSFSVFGTDYPTRDGSCIRDYVHVSDIARAHVQALQYLEKTPTRYHVFNLGTGNGVSVLEAIEAFRKVSGINPAYLLGQRREGDVEAIFSDCKKVFKALNWKAKYSLEDMMESAWKWEMQMGRD
jgi:UDP-glucose 4-epimerase